MRFLHLVSMALLLISPIAIGESHLYSQDVEEKIGDWIITEDTVIGNKTLVLQGNLLIKGGGLKLVNSRLEIKSYAMGQFRIEVQNGYLILNNSTITSNFKENRYYIVIKRGSTLYSVDSIIEYSGYEEGEKSGLYVEGEVKFENSTIRYSYCPLWGVGLEDRDISYIKIYGNSMGVMLEKCQKIRISHLNITKNRGMGVWLREGRENRIENNSIEGIWKNQGNARGIILENESNDIVANNMISMTGMEGIFLSGSRCNNNLIKNNTLISNGIAGIHLSGAVENRIINNNMSSSSIGLSINGGYLNRLEENVFYTKNGVRLSHTDDTVILKGKFRNIERYGILLYSSNKTQILSANFENGTICLFLKNSVVIFSGYLSSDNYRIVGDSKLYISRWKEVKVYDHMGRPMGGVKLKLKFLGEVIQEDKTWAKGNVGFYAPYILHTSREKIYSWCEISADANISFEENPIRFYAWEKKDVVFRERVPGLHVEVFVDKKEAMPGDLINITVIVRNETSYLDNASIDIKIDGMEVFPPESEGRGKYTTKIRLPDFNSSIRICVNASFSNMSGASSITIMKPPLANEETLPSNSGKEIPWFIYMTSIILILFIFIILYRINSKKSSSIDNYKPLSKEKLRIER